MQPFSNTTISTILTPLASGHFYSSIKAQTRVSAGTVTKIHQQHCPETVVSLGGHPRKLTTTNIKCQLKIWAFKQEIGLLILSSACSPEHGGNKTLRSLSDCWAGIDFSCHKVARNVMRGVNRNCMYTNKQQWDLLAIKGTKDLVQSI